MKAKTKNGLIILIMLSLVFCIVVLPVQAAQKPVADLSVSKTSGDTPLKVTFTDKSTGGKALWKWWGFGDGTGSSSTANTVTHTYKKAGKYTVFLKATNKAGTSTKTYPTPIIVGKKPDAKFFVTPTSGYAPLKVTFTDQSTNDPLWKWWGFGDGTGSSSTANTVTYTYKNAGKYTVFLKVTNSIGTDTETYPIPITVESKTADKIVYKFYKNNGKDMSPWGVPLKDLPVYKGCHLPAKEGYMAVESQYNFVDDSISGKNKDPTNGDGYYFNTLSPDNMQWKWNGKNILLGTIKLIPGSADHVSIDKNGIKHWPSGKGAKVRIYSPYTGKAVIAVVGENGPAPWTGRQFGASNKVFKALGLLEPHNGFSKENPNPGHGSINSDPAKYPVIKYANNPYWVEVSWADQNLPAGPCK